MFHSKISVDKVREIVSDTLLTISDKAELSGPVTEDAEMGAPAEWDSLSFIVVFNAISEILDVELEDDDAIHFTSIPAMHAFLNEIMEE